jgi:hypothetical protein
MKEATRDDAAYVAHLLDVNKESVWEIIKGMQYSAQSELAMAVHNAFRTGPLDARAHRHSPEITPTAVPTK